MNNKGLIRVFAIVMALVCIYQLSFTLVTNRVESKAKAFAKGDPEKERYFLDSVAHTPVYNLLVKKYTYMECKERELNLGLDLQGGMNVTLEVSQAELIKALANNNPDPKFNQAVDNAAKIAVTSQRQFIDIFGEEYEKLNPNGRLSALFNTKENKGLIDYSSTNSQVLAFLKDEANRAIDRSFQILGTRIDKFGVTQPNIQKLENSGRILVELPGVDNPARVRKLLQSTARLEFWETYDNGEDMFKMLDTVNKTIAIVEGVAAGNDTSKTETATGDDAVSKLLESQTSNTRDTTKTDLLAKVDTAASDTSKKSQEQLMRENPLFAVLVPAVDQTNGFYKGARIAFAQVKDTSKINKWFSLAQVRNLMPSNLKLAWGAKQQAPSNPTVELYALKASTAKGGPALDGSVVTTARDDNNPLTGEKEVSMQMNTQGAKIWKALTAKNIGHSVAIVLDDAVYSAPNVNGEIPNGSSSISGNFTTEEAKDLANILQTGKLPAPSRIIEEAVVGPTLGKESITAGLLSLILGFIGIIIFMVIYYNSGGLAADLAVVCNVFFIFGVLASLGAALTLPGIAGIVLTMAMAVDANVLIFERIKEELHHGKALKQAITAGYKGAMSAIIDSNLTALISGIVLMLFGTGPIYGFAIILIIGIISSMFTAIFLSRLIVDWRTENHKEVKFETNLSRNLFKGSTIDWVGKRKYYYMFSGAIILGGIISLATKGLSYGVDFKGGWSYVVQLDKDANTSQIAGALKASLDGNTPEVKSYGSRDKVKITTSYRIDDQGENTVDEVKSKVLSGLKEAGFTGTILTTNKVGATIASDTRRSAFIAIFISVALIFVYIVFRFNKWQFGLGAAIALFHDVLIVFSLFTILDGVVPFSLEIDQAFIAAMLTIMGYSMSDTVVVFDRIREFLGLHKGEKDYLGVINSAINNTLNRTIVTSFTIFLVCFILFVFGGTAIKSFSFALLVGVVVGTYSSICIATPVVIDFVKDKTKILN